jgi:hypothetical protein
MFRDACLASYLIDSEEGRSCRLKADAVRLEMISPPSETQGVPVAGMPRRCYLGIIVGRTGQYQNPVASRIVSSARSIVIDAKSQIATS